MNITSKHSVRLALISVFAFLLSACEPDYQSTADLCAIGEDLQAFPNPASMDVMAGEDEYRLYLQDLFRGLQFNDGEGFEDDVDGLTAAEKLEVLDNVIALINREDFFNYELKATTDVDGNAGDPVKSSNPLDLFESIISSTNPDVVVELFDSIRRQIQDGINANDNYCNYSNRNIEITVDSQTIFGEIQFSYDPFSEIVQQTVLLTSVREELDSGFDRSEIPYVGFYQAKPEEFKRSGYIQPTLRQAIIQNDDNDETLLLDDGFDNNLGQIEFQATDSYCAPVDDEDNPSDFGDCPTDGSVVIREVARTECTQDPTEEEPDLINETNKRQQKTFDLGSNPAVQGLKRMRLEVDYENSEVRIYVSKHSLNGAVQDENATPLTGDTPVDERYDNVVFEPTNCETQAILDALFIAQGEPSGGVRLIQIADRGYDIDYELDSEGERVQVDGQDVEIEPTPIITYSARTVADREIAE